MRFWIKRDGDIIRDIIEFEHEGYEAVEIQTPLPIGINAGYYRWKDGGLVLDQELKEKVDKANRPADYVELEQRLAATEARNEQLAEESNANQLALMELHMLVLSVVSPDES